VLIFFGPVKKWFGPVKVLPLLDQMSSEVQGTFGMTGNSLIVALLHILGSDSTV
jgi:hypothetical protein